MPLLYPSFECLSLSRDTLDFIQRLSVALNPDMWKEAWDEARKIEAETGVAMTVESFKPSHFGWSLFKMPVGSHTASLKNKVKFYAAGVFNIDENWTTIKFWEGARVNYLFDWFVQPVALTETHSQSMWPQHRFTGTFTFEVVREGDGAYADGWLIAYVVLPETMRESKIIR